MSTPNPVKTTVIPSSMSKPTTSKDNPTNKTGLYLIGCGWGGLFICVTALLVLFVTWEWSTFHVLAVCVVAFIVPLLQKIWIAGKSIQREAERARREAERDAVNRDILLYLQKNQSQVNTTEEIHKLGELFSSGVITQEEFERGKSLFLGAPKDRSQEILEALSNLQQLKNQGAISESEYNMTKWELLSGKLVK